MVAVLAVSLIPHHVSALAGPHSYTNVGTGDVFLGGDYIELGISKYGSFGTTAGQALPSGFYGTAVRTNVGMSTNPSGFGESPDLRSDYFLPGSPEERWAVGYKIGGTPSTASNAFLNGTTGISNNTVTNQSSGVLLKATSTGSFNDLLTTQVVSFNAGDKFFKNQVTLKNTGTVPLDSVRYLRIFDPDNTRDKGGAFVTRNRILFTHAAGDGKAVVMADTSNTDTDPVYIANGSRSPILFFSDDTRAKVSTSGSTTSPYTAAVYDSAPAKGTDITQDQMISIAFDVGTLAADASQTVTYYTSLDNRDFSDVLEDIEEDAEESSDDGDNITSEIEEAGPNNGDSNGDGTADSEQANVTTLPNPVRGGTAYQTLQTDGCETITSVAVNPVSDYGDDGDLQYPLGMTDFTVDCPTAGDTATITIFYDDRYDTSTWKARKYSNGSFSDVPGASFGTATVGSVTVSTLTYTVIDGGVLDEDGAANGTIVDPIGPAVVLAAEGAIPGAPSTGFSEQGTSLPFMAVAAGLTILASQILPQRRTRHVFNRIAARGRR